MSAERLPCAPLYSELSDGARKVGAPKMRFKDQLKNSLSKCDITKFKVLANDRGLSLSAVFHRPLSFARASKLVMLHLLSVHAPSTQLCFCILAAACSNETNRIIFKIIEQNGKKNGKKKLIVTYTTGLQV